MRGHLYNIFFLFLHENKRCAYSLEATRFSWASQRTFFFFFFFWRNKKNIITFWLKRRLIWRARINLYNYNFILNPFLPSGLFYHSTLDRSRSNWKGVWLFLLLLLQCLIEIPVLRANSVDPSSNAAFRSATDQGLHCLPISLLWDTRHKWVNEWLIFILLFYFIYLFIYLFMKIDNFYCLILLQINSIIYCEKRKYIANQNKKKCYIDRYEFRYIHFSYLINLNKAKVLRIKPVNITKTCLYNFDPLKPHVYIVKLGFTGVYIIFLILLKT